MECTIATLIACFHMSGLYIDSGLQLQDEAGLRQIWSTTQVNVLPGVTETVKTYALSAEPLNPYGRLAVGYGIDFRSVSLSLEVAHVSSLATNEDRGVNSLQLRARWYPFR